MKEMDFKTWNKANEERNGPSQSDVKGQRQGAMAGALHVRKMQAKILQQAKTLQEKDSDKIRVVEKRTGRKR